MYSIDDVRENTLDWLYRNILVQKNINFIKDIK